jgi:hypothetical protein
VQLCGGPAVVVRIMIGVMPHPRDQTGVIIIIIIIKLPN